MRCLECNVDLGENYKKCPLCGAAAVDEVPLVEGITTAEYPKYDDSVLLSEKTVMKKNFYGKYLIPVVIAFELGFIVAAAMGHSAFWSVGVPVLLVAAYVVYLVCGLLQKKGTLLYGCEYMMKLSPVVVLSLLGALFARSGFWNMVICGSVCLFLFNVLALIRPERAKAQFYSFLYLG